MPFKWPDGNICEGILDKNGSGWGKIDFGDIIFEGEILNGLWHGSGVEKLSNGEFKGFWKNDKKDGKGITHYLNGDQIEAFYFEGR